jgi:hypothetical protein
LVNRVAIGIPEGTLNGAALITLDGTSKGMQEGSDGTSDGATLGTFDGVPDWGLSSQGQGLAFIKHLPKDLFL